MSRYPYQLNCPDCGTPVGEQHSPGCDIKRCPKCGCQAISCGCVYEGRPGMDDGPDPTDEDYDAWDAEFEAEWGGKRQPWSGYWPGAAECWEYGWWARLVPGKGWVSCDEDAPWAGEDLIRLVCEGVWDADAQRWRKRPGA